MGVTTTITVGLPKEITRELLEVEYKKLGLNVNKGICNDIIDCRFPGLRYRTTDRIVERVQKLESQIEYMFEQLSKTEEQ